MSSEKSSEVDPIFSKTSQAIMDKEKIGGFYMDELAIIVILPIFATFVVGDFAVKMLGAPSTMPFFMGSMVLEVFTIRFFVSAKKKHPPNYIFQIGFTNLDGMTWGPFKDKRMKIGNEKKMENYSSIKKVKRYSA